MKAEDRFKYYYGVQFLGALNDNIIKNALVILITYQSITIFGLNSKSLVAASAGLYILPFFLFSYISGQLADSLEKIKLIRYTKLLEFIIMIFASIGFYFKLYPFLLLCLFLMGVQSTLFGPIKYSILSEIVEEKKLLSANARVEMGTFLAILMGTIWGVQSVSGDLGIWIVIGSITGVSLLGYLLTLKIKPLLGSNKKAEINFNFFTGTYSVLRGARNHIGVYKSIIGISWFWFLGASILTLLPALSKNVFQSKEEVVTLFLSLFTVGIAVGSMLCEKLSKEKINLSLVAVGALGMSLFLFDFSFLQVTLPDYAEPQSLSEFFKMNGSMRAVIDLFGISLFGGLYIVPLYVYIQKYTEQENRSKIIAANNMYNALFMVISAICLIIFSKYGLSIQKIFLVLSALNIICFVYVFINISREFKNSVSD